MKMDASISLAGVSAYNLHLPDLIYHVYKNAFGLYLNATKYRKLREKILFMKN